MTTNESSPKFRVAEVIAAMDRWAPPATAYEWDRCGLATGDPSAPCTRVITALTVTQAVVETARKAKADLIVAHHPLIWEPIRSLRSDRAETRAALELARANIACYAAHTNLDIAPNGVNHVLADRIGVEDRQPLFDAPGAQQVKLVTFVPAEHLAHVRQRVSAAGAGVIGDYTHCSFSTPGTGTFLPGSKSDPFSGAKHVLNEEAEHRFEIILLKARLPEVVRALKEAHPYEEVAYDVYPLENPDPYWSLGLRGTLPSATPLETFAAHVKDALEIEHVRFSGDPAQPVQTVALMGGAGGAQAPRVPAGIDVYVTGDLKYHDAIDAVERGMAVVDAGHHGTEKWIVPAMQKYLHGELPGLDVAAYNEPDPFRIA